ncbi:MAG TPA: HAMP domain-containing sensor histidine kinase [Chitinophagaceae bacterium]|nr:HAMP domain-containing sensor histidine kinase [Chitinophagaceae bacterium]
MEQPLQASHKHPDPLTSCTSLDEQAVKELLADKAVTEGRLEIASNVLHDIGNAIVGFGSYITRIRRSLDQTNAESLQKMAEFFTVQQPALSAAIGEEKANAVLKLLNSIADAQKNSQEEIRRSVADQLSIVTHIQEILHIHRQYANGNGVQMKVPINFRAIINDCIAMFFASLEKRNIKVSVSVPDELPEFRAHRPRLMQVMLNILKNSIEAIDINAPEKTISIVMTSAPGLIVIKVQDNGQGFDNATGDHLFQRGFTTKASGSGLGLNSCRAIIESYGGTMSITSEGHAKGALTTISLTI